MSRLRAESSEASGSSSSRRRGRISSARPTAMRWRSPPESLSRSPIEQVADVEQLDHVVECRRVGFAAADPAPVFEIVSDSEVRKQPAFLENIADAAAPGRHIDLRGTVEHHFAIEFYAAAIRPQETGNHVDHAGFPRTRGPEQGCRAGFRSRKRRPARTRRGVFPLAP